MLPNHDGVAQPTARSRRPSIVSHVQFLHNASTSNTPARTPNRSPPRSPQAATSNNNVQPSVQHTFDEEVDAEDAMPVMVTRKESIRRRPSMMSRRPSLAGAPSSAPRSQQEVPLEPQNGDGNSGGEPLNMPQPLQFDANTNSGNVNINESATRSMNDRRSSHEDWDVGLSPTHRLAGSFVSSLSMLSPTRARSPNRRKRRLETDTTRPVLQVPVEALITFAKFAAKKTVVYRTFPLYVSFLSILIFTLLLPRTLNMSYTADGIKERIFLSKPKDVISEPADVWKWLEPALPNLWDTPTQVLPTLYLVIRQYRRGLKECSVPSLVPEHLRRNIPKRCYVDEWSADPIPDKNGTALFSVTERDFRTATRYGSHGVYSASAPHFLETFSYTKQSVADVRNRINYLKDKNWIRTGVGLILVESFFVNRARDHYAHFEVLVEVHQSGYTSVVTHSYMFSIMHPEVWYGMLSFILEVIVMVLSVGLLWEVVSSIRFNLWFDSSWYEAFEMFDLFNLGLVGLVMALQYYRFSLYNMIFTLDANSTSDDVAFDWLLKYKTTYEAADRLAPWTVLLAFFRSFLYLQYNQRMGVIYETVLSSFNDLFGVAIIFCMILFSYATAVYYLWGTTVDKYRTVVSSFLSLLQIMLSGKIGDWEPMFEAHHLSTYPMFLSFIAVTWLVILNIMVSILATSFGAVFETTSLQMRPRWHPVDIVRDVKTYLHRLLERAPPELKVEHHPTGALNVRSHFVVQCLRTIELLKSFPRDRIGLNDFRALTEGVVDSARAETMFRKAFQQVGNQNARMRQQQVEKRSMTNRRKVTNQVVSQTTILNETHAKIFGRTIPPNTGTVPRWMLQEQVDGELRATRSEVAQIGTCVEELSRKLQDQIDDLTTVKRIIGESGTSGFNWNEDGQRRVTTVDVETV
eukprot:PhM_4_TR16814/c0_g1_i12/m.104531/K04986/PKD2; polycystin 2